jgi:hypothetical protein
MGPFVVMLMSGTVVFGSLLLGGAASEKIGCESCRHSHHASKHETGQFTASDYGVIIDWLSASFHDQSAVSLNLCTEKLGYLVTARSSSINALAMFRVNPANFDFVKGFL